MKKFILTITVAAFTFGAYAGPNAGADACCAKAKAATCTSNDKVACTASTTAGKKCTAKCSGKKIVHSPKGAAASQS